MWHFCTIWIPNDVSLYRMKNIQAMLNVRDPESVKLLLLKIMSRDYVIASICEKSLQCAIRF